MKPLTVAILVVGSVVLAALVALFVYLSNWGLTVTNYRLAFANAPQKAIRIAHLSDLHARNFGKNNKKLIEAVERCRPDFIAFTGDIVHKYRERDLRVAEYTVRALSRVAPVFFVSGNHEMRSRKWRELKRRLTECGATVLDDERAEICGVNVVGLNCASLKNRTPFALAEGLEGFKLLLAHKPEMIDRYAMAGYDLALCGHAHGGQWRLPFTGIGFFSPGQGLFPKYASGVHTCGNMRQVISRGLGNSQCPLRLFNRPELVVVDIEKE